MANNNTLNYYRLWNTKTNEYEDKYYNVYGKERLIEIFKKQYLDIFISEEKSFNKLTEQGIIELIWEVGYEIEIQNNPFKTIIKQED